MARSTRLLAFLALFIAKRGRNYDFFRISRNPDAQKWPGARDCWIFCDFSWQKQPGTTIFFVFLEILLLKNGPEHETVGFFATFYSIKRPELRFFSYFEKSCCSKMARSTRLLAFLRFFIAERGRNYDFFRILRNPATQKWPGARDCWLFCYFL